MRRRAREYDEYRTVLRGSGTRGGLRGSDPKKGIFEYDEYRTVLRRDGRLRDFEYDEYRTVLGERDQKASTSAFSRVQRYPVKRPYSIEYRCYSETAARLTAKAKYTPPGLQGTSWVLPPFRQRLDMTSILACGT